MLRHTQVERFKTDIQQECILRRLNAAKVTHQLCGSFGDISHFAESFCISQAVIRFVGCTQSGEFVGIGIPVEVSAIHDGTAYAGGVAVHIFGGGMYHDIGTPFERAAVNRSREGIVYNQRHAVAVGDAGELFDIEHFQRRVGDGLTKQCLGVRAESG